ncbi:MAG: LptA/OstA family protein [Candidatus Korobacteraceae bacterium]
MPLSIPRLRVWFATLAMLVLLVVAGFYFYARLQSRSFLRRLPQKLGVEIQQSTEGFSFSKSEGGRTLFTIRAARAIQYAEGGRARLHDVSIVVYGREGTRFDQIYGSEFEYDPRAGTITATGEVNIDLEGNAAGPQQPDQSLPRELRNPIHLKTSGLVFNQKSGVAHTPARIEFSVAQAEGSAVGATYDTRKNELALGSQVTIRAHDREKTTLQAAHGYITKDPREVILSAARMQQPGRNFECDHAELLLNPANDLQKVIATGNVRLTSEGPNGATLRSPWAEMTLGEKSQIQKAVFGGGVQAETLGANAATASAGRLTVNFAENRPLLVHATEEVRIRRTPGQGGATSPPASSALGMQAAAGSQDQQTVEITSAATDLHIKEGRLLSYAESLGPAQVSITPVRPSVPGEHTVITAARMRAEFDDDNRLTRMRGEPGAKVTSIVPGQPDKVSTSDSVAAQFAPGGGITEIRQEGDFRYSEAQGKNAPLGPGGRFAYAERARYTPESDAIALSGSPRIVDGGMTITANSLRIERRSGDAFAQGAVKTTYSELRRNAGGAILATADPVHVTAGAANLHRESGMARYSGDARLWQGADVVEAPAIEFDRPNRRLVAEGAARKPVTSVFVQVGKDGKTTTVIVSAARLVYNDSTRRARYTGGVLARGEGLTLTAGSADVLLAPAEEKESRSVISPSRLERIIAQGNVDVRQQERSASGEKLVYTAADEKFVLTGGPPSLADPQHGTVRGDSLTFYSRDDRVLVDSKEFSRAVTRTRIIR